MSNLDNKLDKIASDVQDIKIVLARQDVILEKNTESLNAHMARTFANEKRIDQVEKYMYRSMGFTGAVILLISVIAWLYSNGILTKLV
jgi:hypothetical protein